MRINPSTVHGNMVFQQYTFTLIILQQENQFFLAEQHPNNRVSSCQVAGSSRHLMLPAFAAAGFRTSSTGSMFRVSANKPANLHVKHQNKNTTEGKNHGTTAYGNQKPPKKQEKSTKKNKYQQKHLSILYNEHSNTQKTKQFNKLSMNSKQQRT